MKILDDIMARDRAGTPVTYRDLLEIRAGVVGLESDMVRAVHADTTKSQYISQLREQVSLARAQLEASLDPLVRTKMMAPAPAVVLHLPTTEQLTKAFAMWETASRAGGTLTHEEVAQMSVQEVAARNAEHFHALLGEVLR